MRGSCAMRLTPNRMLSASATKTIALRDRFCMGRSGQPPYHDRIAAKRKRRASFPTRGASFRYQILAQADGVEGVAPFFRARTLMRDQRFRSGRIAEIG